MRLVNLLINSTFVFSTFRTLANRSGNLLKRAITPSRSISTARLANQGNWTRPGQFNRFRQNIENNIPTNPTILFQDNNGNRTLASNALGHVKHEKANYAKEENAEKCKEKPGSNCFTFSDWYRTSKILDMLKSKHAEILRGNGNKNDIQYVESSIEYYEVRMWAMMNEPNFKDYIKRKSPEDAMCKFISAKLEFIEAVGKKVKEFELRKSQFEKKAPVDEKLVEHQESCIEHLKTILENSFSDIKITFQKFPDSINEGFKVLEAWINKLDSNDVSPGHSKTFKDAILTRFRS